MRILPPKSVIGMVHLAALPGAPQGALRLNEIVARAVEEAVILTDAGMDAVLIENMHDRPYGKGAASPEIVAAMTAAAVAIRAACGLPAGIQVLAAANREALAVALAADLDFIRVEGFVFGHVADEGYIDGCAGELLRYRRQIGGDHIRIFADIKKKHAAHALTADIDVAETARAAEFFLADGIIVTGTRTGASTDLADVEAAKHASRLPVFVGSGITAANVAEFLPAADGVIVGSSIKTSGEWTSAVDPDKCRRLVDAAKRLGK